MQELVGKVAIVTGGGRGIGKAIALNLAKNGAHVLICYKEDSDAAENTLSEIKKISEGAAYKVDVSSEHEVNTFMSAVISEYKKVDILINNAGIQGEKKQIFEYDFSAWSEVLSVNLNSAFLCSKAVLPGMMVSRSGKIINISSIAAFEGYPGCTPYAVSKAGLLTLTKSLAKEVANFNVNVNAIIPGITDTDMAKKLSQETIATILKKIPFNRIACPGEIADLALFLSSERSSYITGEHFKITGGR